MTPGGSGSWTPAGRIGSAKYVTTNQRHQVVQDRRLPSRGAPSDITLILRGAVITGTLLDPDGQPIPGVAMRACMDSRRRPADGRHDHDGRTSPTIAACIASTGCRLRVCDSRARDTCALDRRRDSHDDGELRSRRARRGASRQQNGRERSGAAAGGMNRGRLAMRRCSIQRRRRLRSRWRFLSAGRRSARVSTFSFSTYQ